LTLYIVVPLLLLVTVIQTALVPYLSIWGIFADVPLLMVVSWSLLQGRREGLVWGFVAGAAIDILSGAPFGAATLSLSLVGFVAGLGEATVFRTHVALPLVAAFLATLVYDLLFLLVVRMMGQQVLWLDSLLRTVLPSAVLNAVLVPLVFLPLRFAHRRFVRQEMEY
jgi:rod shape-determining protein MreD